MGRITSSTGLITGTDIAGTVDKLIALSAAPRDRMTTQVNSLKGEQLAVGQLTALVVGVQLQATRLGQADNLSAVNATSSNSDVLTVTAGTNPVAGNYQVRTLATAQASAQISSAFESSSAQLTAGDLTVRTGGFVDRTSKLDSLRGGAGVERGKIQITNRAGETKTVDLRNAVTINDVVDAINKTADLKVNAQVSGDKIVLSDFTGQSTTNLTVGEVDGGRTAADLGFSAVSVGANQATGTSLSYLSANSSIADLRDGRGLDFSKGTDLTLNLSDGSRATIDIDDTTPIGRLGTLIDKINAKANGKFEARISSDGVSLEFVDKTSGSGSFSATGNLADSLGLSNATASSGVLHGDRVQSSLNGNLLSTLNGGDGLALGTLKITNRTGASADVDLSQAKTLDQVIDLINQSSSGVTASYNRSRTGIKLTDNTGGTASNLVVADAGSNDTATKLGFAADVASSSIEGTSLNAQYVSRSTKLSDLNDGQGVRLGSFTITNSAGGVGAVNLTTSGAQTVGDVIDAINKLNINVQAKLNDAGDGFYLVDNSGGAGQMTVADTGQGSAAKDLKILGTSKDTTIDGQTKKAIESNQNYKITVAEGDTLTSLVAKITADSGSPIQASLLNTGNGSVRLVLASKTTGQAGRVFVDGDSVGITTTQSSLARDAVISVGSGDDFSGTLVTSSTNDFKDVLPGLTLSVKSVSSDPVSVSATKSYSKIETNLKLFVDQYNKVIDNLNTTTAYDATTQTSGYLFGSTAALRTQQAMNDLITGRVANSSKIKSLTQLGVNVGNDGKLTLDTTKLEAAVDADPAAVTTFMSEKDNGFSDRAKSAMERLVGVDKGSVLINRNDTLQRRIDDLGKRIDAFNVRLDSERTRLTKQFNNMESAIAKIQSNLSGLNLSAFTNSSSG